MPPNSMPLTQDLKNFTLKRIYISAMHWISSPVVFTLARARRILQEKTGSKPERAKLLKNENKQPEKGSIKERPS